jgi:hypothetical protein
MNPLTLPMILSGPIIRRAEESQVNIWIATSKSVRLHAKLFTITAKPGQNSYHYRPFYTHCETKTIRMGKQLFVHLIKITPLDGTFPINTLLGYNLKFRRGTEIEDLASLGLLTKDNPQSIVYGNLDYPTFQIKNSKNECHILYGSCRKPHGDGEDTLTEADLILEKEFGNLKTRPSSLFLMGDQIYADDVASPLAPVISTFAEQLIGRREPLNAIEPLLRKKTFQTAFNQINGRQFIMDNLCKFTSPHSGNHLMEFGEYAAMYLMTWSPQLWEVAQENLLFNSFEGLLAKKQIYFAFPNDELFEKVNHLEQTRVKNQFNEQQETLISFQTSLYQVRRILANIPTYMIFDDHDITDDWNISLNWKEDVRKSPLGSHVVANGLAAYWAFQGWGNAPDSFDDKFLWVMKTYFKSLTFGKIKSFREKWVDMLWNFHSWHFVAPTNPKSIFFDTRTQREYDLEPKPVKFGHLIEETSKSPQLLSKAGWESVTRLLFDHGWKSRSPIIVVTPTPVYGMGLIESFLHDYVYPLRVLGVDVQTTIDFEAWKYNGKGFTEFLQQVTDWNPSNCIILSGDVHYASAVKATITFANGKQLNVNQFTSSPIKNMSLTGLWGALLKLVMGLNSYRRKNNEIYRICTPSYTIEEVEKENVRRPYIWRDRLMYQILADDSIIETNNNLGYLVITNQAIQGTLLKKTDE